MKAVRQTIYGTLRDKNTVILPPLGTEPDKNQRLILRYALLTRGFEHPVFPAYVLDDWGNEINSLSLYRWLYDNGDQYPRATIFGFDKQGKSFEWFAREIEYQWKYACFAFANPSVPIEDGTMIHTIARINPTLTAPKKEKRLTETKAPFKRARVNWWEIPSAESIIP